MSHEPTEASVSTVITVRFSFQDGDWCEAHLNESTGLLSINAGHGNFSHGWRLGSNLGIDPPFTLMRGIDGFCTDYLASKLIGGTGLVYDAERTERAVREYVNDLAWEVPEEEFDRLDFETYDALLLTSDHVEWFDEPWFFAQYSDSKAAHLLKNRYIPALKSWVKDQVHGVEGTQTNPG